MMNYKKYQRQYYMPPAGYTDWVNKESVEHAPVWCSVDLRDGNQALVIPMSLEQKLDFFKLQMCIRDRLKARQVQIEAPVLPTETRHTFS